MFEKWADGLIPPGVTGVLRWRLLISLCIFFFAMHVGVACGFFDKYGFHGFTTSSDVSMKLEAKIQPLQTKMDTVIKQLTTVLASGKAAEIRTLAAKRCLAKGPEAKESYNNELDIKQREYHDIMGDYYDIPHCNLLN